MAESKIDIIIRTIKEGFGDKETKKSLKDLGAGFKDLTGISLGWAGAIGTGAAALKKFVDMGKQGVDAVVNLSNTTDKFRRITGEGADSLSRFIQVADDARIDVDSLQAAMQLAANKGFDVSTSSIMRMSDEYLKLAPGVERNTYVSKIFGKQSGEITKILEMGSAAIRDRMEATDASITLDDSAVDASIEYQVALDNLNDAVLALKMSLGKGLIPELTRFATDLSQFPTWFSKQDDPRNPIGAIGVSGGMSKEQIAKLREELGQMQRATAAASVGADRFDKMSGSVGNTKDEMAGLNEELLKATISVTDWESKFSNAKDAGAQFDLSLDLIRSGLQDMGSTGEDAYRSILLGLGEITPAAVKALAETETVISSIKRMLAQGYSIQIVVDFVTNWKNGGSATPAWNPLSYNPDTGMYEALNDTAPKPQSNVNSNLPAGQRINGKNGYYDNNGVWHGWDVRAAGGEVFPGMVAIVGEKGPEPVLFGNTGRVLPAGSGLGNNITINVNGAGDARAVANEVMHQLRLQGIAR